MTSMMWPNCNICATPFGPPAIDLAPPALTTTNQSVDLPTRVFICGQCGHIQSPELPDLGNFYDTQYRISLESEEHDQIYATANGKPIYRTDVQAQVVLELCSLKPSAKVLDYGAAKGATLRKIKAKRGDIEPHIFDISDDYRKSWAAWLPGECCATYDLDPTWKGRFDLITAHYVLEHVPQAVASLKHLKSFLAPDGAIFFSVPDWEANPGDLLVADHVNHFTETSIRRAVREAGMKVQRIERTLLPTAFTVVCVPTGIEPNPNHADVARSVKIGVDCAAGLSRACARLDEKFAAGQNRKSAIFGSGFYGMFLFTRAAGKVSISSFLDNNPHLWSTKIFDVAVLPPKSLPDNIEVVYVGLNPTRARAIVKETPALQRAGLELIFLDTSP